MKQRTWVYHAKKEPMIVNQDEADRYYAKGWADTPAKFFDDKKLTKHGIDPKNEFQVQQAKKVIEGVADSLDGALNLELMTKKQLVRYADKHFGEELNSSLSKRALLTVVKAMSRNEEDPKEKIPAQIAQ